jgi:hypothetical protein
MTATNQKPEPQSASRFKKAVTGGSLLVLFLLIAATVRAEQTRWHEYTAKFKTPKNPVEVKLASFVGGTGTEWLAGAGYQPDGTLVVAGTALGPELALAGKTVPVLGADGTAPAAGAVAEWTSASGAPFVAWLGDGVKRAVRLPWGTGSACGAVVDEKGDIYLAGKAGEKFAGTDVTPADGARENGTVFVIKLAADGSRVVWTRTFANVGKGIRLRYHGGNILTEGEWGYVFKPDGSLVRVVASGKTKGTKSINPVDWTVATGWDSNTNTGREPWRRPGLRLEFAPETKRESKHIFTWDPKVVGSDKYRLVSDSSIRLIYFDNAGRMHTVGWSDGGNTVFERQPTDLDKSAPKDRLGFSTWGANVGSFAHVMTVRTDTYETTSKALWTGYLTGKNKPAGGSIEQLAIGTDGSMLLSGECSWGLIQTGDNVSPEQGNAGGPYLAVLEPDLSSIRFSSAFLGAGKVKLHQGNSWAPHWNMTTQIVRGRHVAVFVSGALKEEARPMGLVPTPQRNPVQKEFGGGAMDGYIVVMDLGEVALRKKP